MLGTHRVTYDGDNSKITWEYNGSRQSIELKAANQYALDEQTGFIIVLTGAHVVPDNLYLISVEDGSCKSVQQPSGFAFYYLTNHSKLGVSVVCVSDDPVEGWRDWHFSFDPASNNLIRAIPAH
ncbi:hypothetical protein [uncultured Marinobacter sp.]|uniref:hypothetical protein n=1 Tax=uncultured Marinobacter sp. TaxID=187379 RepID=UPI00260BFCC1|nr:hypothetical protein [uncultured Marinobacter sp.]